MSGWVTGESSSKILFLCCLITPLVNALSGLFLMFLPSVSCAWSWSALPCFFFPRVNKNDNHIYFKWFCILLEPGGLPLPFTREHMAEFSSLLHHSSRRKIKGKQQRKRECSDLKRSIEGDGQWQAAVYVGEGENVSGCANISRRMNRIGNRKERGKISITDKCSIRVY